MVEETLHCESCDGYGTMNKKCRHCDEEGLREKILCPACDDGHVVRTKPGIGIRPRYSVHCTKCDGRGYFQYKCDRDNCDNGYIQVDCLEKDPHTWTRYKCQEPGCDASWEERGGNETDLAYSLSQHEFKCARRND